MNAKINDDGSPNFLPFKIGKELTPTTIIAFIALALSLIQFFNTQKRDQIETNSYSISVFESDLMELREDIKIIKKVDLPSLKAEHEMIGINEEKIDRILEALNRLHPTIPD